MSFIISMLFTAGTGKTKAYFSVMEGGADAVIGDKEAEDIVVIYLLVCYAP